MRALDQLVARIQTTLRAHREFVLILVLSSVFRLTAILVFRPGGFLGDISNFGHYRLLLSFVLQGYYPHVDFWVEYPPVFPWLLVGLYRLSLLIPAWSEPGAWFFMLLSTFLAAIEAGNLILFYAIARRCAKGRAVQLCWVYVALLIPVLTIFISFDGLVLLFLLWAVLLTLDGRASAAGIATGFGFMTKIVPVVLAPAALQHMKPWSQRLKYTAAVALTVLAIALPFLTTGPDFLIPSFSSPMSRSSWETVWALADGYYSFGVAGGWDRFDPARAGAGQHPSRLPWTLITIGFGLLFLAIYTQRIDWASRRKVVAFTALTQNLLILYSKGYSPQFLVMLLPFAILLIPGWRGIAYALLLSIINLIEFPVYFVVLPEEHWLLVGTVLLRTLIVVVLSIEYAAQVYDWQAAERWLRRSAAAVTLLVVVVSLVGVVFGFRAYAQSRYEHSPRRAALDLLAEQAEPGAVVVVDDQLSYEKVYPFLHNHFDVILVETLDYLPPWEPRLEEAVAASLGQVWAYTRADSPLYPWFAERHPPLARHDLDGWQLSGWDTR